VETDTQTHTQTHKPSTVTLAAHARRGLINMSLNEFNVLVFVPSHKLLSPNRLALHMAEKL